MKQKLLDSNGEVEWFCEDASTVLEMVPGAEKVQLAPNGVTTYVYPLQGNESIIGHDILNEVRSR